MQRPRVADGEWIGNLYVVTLAGIPEQYTNKLTYTEFITLEPRYFSMIVKNTDPELTRRIHKDYAKKPDEEALREDLFRKRQAHRLALAGYPKGYEPDENGDIVALKLEDNPKWTEEYLLGLWKTILKLKEAVEQHPLIRALRFLEDRKK